MEEQSSQWRVLLIDDEEDIRQIVSIVLADLGYRVRVAENGEAGLKICLAEHPQIVITDIRMPKMDGLQFLEAVKRMDDEVEVIVMTAFGEMDLAIRALQLDASDFINKPVDKNVLQVALERAGDRYTSRNQLKEYARFLEKENVKTSRELIRTYNLQKNLIESSMDGVVGSGPDDEIVIFNKSMERISGYNRSTVIKRMTLGDLFDEKALGKMKQAFKSDGYGGSGRLLLYEINIQGADDRLIPIQVSAAPMPREDSTAPADVEIETPSSGEPADRGMVIYCRDLRKIRELEMELKDQTAILHQDKMMSLGRLAASIVHEINNPLAGMLNYFKLMSKILKQRDLDQERKDKFVRYLELVETETQRCSKIISNLLAFSRKAEPDFTSVDVRNLIDRCVMLCRHKAELSNIELCAHFKQDDNPTVTGDLNQLQQCLINLIFNAVDAMPEGGDLTISVDSESIDRMVVIWVRDTGVGIAPEDLPHIFEPFFTTKQEGYGVGLGLSTVYGVIQQHGGEIEVKSEKGRGTTFELRLPV